MAVTAAGTGATGPAGGPRTILHVDMDAFYASVEQHRRPELRGRPVAVGGSGSRGVVAAASYEARAYGVRSAMPSVRAKRLCPDLVFIHGDHDLYGEVSGRIMAIFGSFTPHVEPLSLDEAFLDVTGGRRLHGDGATIAATIRAAVQAQESLTCSVGVAPNKFLAKLATEVGKPTASRRGPIPGTGITVVRPGDERAFLRPLPVEALWGVGPKTLEKLRAVGVRTVADLEQLPVAVVVRAVGEASGRHLHALAHGIDDRPVVSDGRPKSIGHEETFPEDLFSHDEVHVHLVRMADAVATRVRRHDLPGRTVSIKVRFGDFSTITRSVTMPSPIDSGPSIVRAASALLDQVDLGGGLRLLGVTLSNLTPDAPRQLSLGDFEAASTPPAEASREVGRRGGSAPVAVPSGDARRGPTPPTTGATTPAADGAAWTAVTAAIDAVRDRFGDDAVVPGTLAADRRAPRPGSQRWGPAETEDESDEIP